jgi:hypothetical protein
MSHLKWFSMGLKLSVAMRPNCSALDARTALCLFIERRWPGASESER